MSQRHNSESTIDAVFAALADPTRRAIVEQLSEGIRSVSELGAPFDVSAPAISKHLRVLQAAGLIKRTKRGRTTYCQLTTPALETARQWWEAHRQFWQQQFDALDLFLEEEHARWQQQPPRKATSSSGSSGASRRSRNRSSTRGRTLKR